MPTTRPAQARSLDTRARLLDATVGCLVAHGYAGTSTTEVCKLAGVSRGAQLHHYPTKAELVAAAVEHIFARRHAEFRKKFGGGDVSIGDLLGALWKIYRGPTLYAWMELVVAARTDPQLQRQVAAVDASFFAQACATFAELFGAQDVAESEVAARTRLVLSTLDGLALHRVVDPDDAHVQRVLQSLQTLLSGWWNR
jgi:AcrR family transcriptional regulator